MPRSPHRFAAESSRPLWVCLGFVLALTAWRVGWLAYNRTDLFTDESQYWFWSTELALGYFSKPPLIAWIIRAATVMAGSAEPFWVRLPAPLLHGATALVVAWLGTMLHGARTGALSGASYAVMPAVGVGSMVISTDTPLMLCFALGLGLFVRLAQKPRLSVAVALGAVVGLGFLAKYAMIYFLLGAGLTVLLVPPLRPPLREGLIALGTFAAIAALNLGWNATQGFVTVAHTVDNAGWGRDWFNPLKLLEFLAAQFGVFGPLSTLALGAAWLGARRARRGDAMLILFSAPIMAIVAIQALRSGANPNWAVAAYVAGTPLAVAWMVENAPRGLRITLALHLAVALLLPVTARYPEAMAIPNGRSVYARLLGREALAHEVAAVARAEGLEVILAENRGLVSDLLYTLRDDDLTILTPATGGPPRHHFDMAVPLPPDLGRDALLVTGDPAPPLPQGFTAYRAVRSWVPDSPWWHGRPIHAFHLSGADG